MTKEFGLSKLEWWRLEGLVIAFYEYISGGKHQGGRWTVWLNDDTVISLDGYRLATGVELWNNPSGCFVKMNTLPEGGTQRDVLRRFWHNDPGVFSWVILPWLNLAMFWWGNLCQNYASPFNVSWTTEAPCAVVFPVFFSQNRGKKVCGVLSRSLDISFRDFHSENDALLQFVLTSVCHSYLSVCTLGVGKLVQNIKKMMK